MVSMKKGVALAGLISGCAVASVGILNFIRVWYKDSGGD